MFKSYSYSRSNTLDITPMDEFSTGSIPHSTSPRSTASNTPPKLSFDMSFILFPK